ncbi:MAG: alpha-amlyase [Bacteroidetes bacterium GWF2_49_14]|nr:MAG: alpha-amlyase [Bacteroidetes bacterium GWF2_49_14]
MKTGVWRILLLISLMGVGQFSSAQSTGIQHVEPPFWWTGMKNPSLQILLHGPGIGQLVAEFSYPGIVIDSVVNPTNPNFLFLYLTLKPEARPGSFEIKLLKEDKINARYQYKLIEREHGSSQRQGFSAADVIYLVTPDRFANGDPDNDYSPATLERPDRSNLSGRHGGDIKGVIEHLDYIADMGFTTLWVNPVLENNQQKASYHGYSITDFYQTDPRFGTNEDYLRLSREASKRGIKLIMDQVMNHCGSGHWWMEDMPYPDWLRTTQTGGPTNHRRTTFNDPYAAKTDRDVFGKGWFVPTMPDMNQGNPHFSRYLIQNSIWWVEYADLHGIRHDTHPYAGADFMSDWTCAIMGEYPDFNIVGEEWSENPAIVSKWQRGYQGGVNLRSCLPGLMDFPLQMSVTKALTEKETWSDGFIRLYEMLANDFLYPDPNNLVIFPDNHDMDRFFTQVNEDPELFKLGIAFFLTTRGIPQIYYGTEILMKNSLRGNHGNIRSDFPGGWTEDTVNGFNGTGLTASQSDAQSFMKKLLNWRKNAVVIHSGQLMHYSPANGAYVYFRYSMNQKIMVVLNKNNNPIILDTRNYSEMLGPGAKFRNVLAGTEFSGDKIQVPAKTPLILEVR